MTTTAPLTPHQSATLATIRRGGVTYSYPPLAPSATRIKPVTQRDLLPIFSHHLVAGTVLALEERSLVRLTALGPAHGKVTALD